MDGFDSSASMSSATAKKTLGFVLQVVVTAIALGFVFHDPRRRTEMSTACRHADWRWLAAGLCVYGLVELLAAVRWQLLLRIQGFDLGWARSTAILFVGEFFLVFTPGLIGGDAMRIYSLVKDQPDKKVDAFSAVLMDRIMGMVSLICLATVIVGLRYHFLDQTAGSARLLHATLVILACGAGTLTLSLVVASVGLPSTWPVPKTLREMADAFRQFTRHRRGTALAFVTTLLAHGCYYTSFCCAARALEHLGTGNPLFWDVFSVMPIENTLTALPISFAGIGLRESILQTLLHDLAGVPSGVGALIGSTGFGMKVLWSLPGAVVFLTHRRTARRAVNASGGSRPMSPA